MSDYETYTGTAKKIAAGAETIEAYAKYKMESQELPDYFHSYTEWLQDEGDYKEWVVIKEELYHLDLEKLQLGDIAHAEYLDDDTYSFTIQFYNGACGVAQALQAALKKV